MTDKTDSAPHASPADRPGPDADLAGIESHVDEEANTVTFLTDRGSADVTTAWLTVDAAHVVDVGDYR